MKTKIKPFILLLFICILNMSLYAQLSGTYKVGAGEIFPTISSAIDTLQKSGVNGAVTLRIKDGTYNEYIVINSFITGSNETNLVTFESESGDSSRVIITHDLTTLPPYSLGLIHLNNTSIPAEGISNIVFRKLTFEIPSQNAGNTINLMTLQNKLRNIHIYNCVFKNLSPYFNPVTMTYLGSICINVGGVGLKLPDSIFIKNNLFIEGNRAMYFDGGGRSKKIIIENNQFINQWKGGIQLKKIDSLDALSIIGNYFMSDSALSEYFGVQIELCNTNLLIANNQFVLGNKAKAAINLYNSKSTNINRASIINNYIHMKDSGSSSYGIGISNAQYKDILFNTIVMDNTDSAVAAIFINTISKGTNIINNILYNISGGYSIYAKDTASISLCDYNNLYSDTYAIGYYGGVKISDFDEWKFLTLFDQHSISADPLFSDKLSYIPCAHELDNTGTPLSEINYDIFNKTRDDITPDIGAYEFSASNLSLELGADTTICKDSSFMLNSDINAVSYLWEPGGETTQGIIIDTAGLYILFAEGNCLATSDTINIYEEDCVSGSVKQSIGQYFLSVYPNPSDGILTLSLPLKTDKIIQASIHNMNGDLLERITLNGFDNNYSLDLSSYSVGIYFINIQTEANIYYSKVSIVR